MLILTQQFLVFPLYHAVNLHWHFVPGCGIAEVVEQSSDHLNDCSTTSATVLPPQLLSHKLSHKRDLKWSLPVK